MFGRQKHKDEASDVPYPDQLSSILVEGLRNTNVNNCENYQEHLDYDNVVWKLLQKSVVLNGPRLLLNIFKVKLSALLELLMAFRELIEFLKRLIKLQSKRIRVIVDH